MRAAAVLDPVAQPVRNYVTNPNMVLGANGWAGGGPTGTVPTLTHLTSGGPFNDSFVRATLPGDATVTNPPWVQTILGVLPPGETFHLSAWVRVSRTTRISFNMVPAFGVSEAHVFSATCEAGKWTLIAGTFRSTASATSTTLRVRFASAAQSGTPMLTGDTLEFTRVACARADADPGPVDGTTPGLRWSGTTDNSESVCYPYTLESIAGRPAAWYDARHLLGRGVALPADGTAVSQWVDLSGNGRHFSQATTALQPRFRSIQTSELLAFGGSRPTSAMTNLFSRGTGVTVSYDAAQYAAKVVMPASVPGSDWGLAVGSGIANYVAVVPGRTYTFRGASMAASGSGTTGLLVYWRDSAGSSAGFTTVQVNTTPNGSFRELSTTAAAPAGAAFAQLVMTGVANQTFHVRGLSVVQGTSLGVSLPGGQPAVQGDGAQWMQTPAFDLGAVATVYVVAAQDRFSATRKILVSHQTATSTTNRFDMGEDGGARTLGGTAGGTFHGAYASGPVLDSLPHVWTGRAEGAPGRRLFFDGVQDAYNANATDPVSGGSGFALLTSWGKGQSNQASVAAVLVYDRAHDDATRKQVEKWLGATYGIAVA